MEQFRIKTESEFVAEFGSEWRKEVFWNPDGKMDHLFAKAITDALALNVTLKGKSKSQSDYLINPDTDQDNYWTIYPTMITSLPLPTPPVSRP